MNPVSIQGLTAQQVFDTVAKHLFEQGSASKADRKCLYRTADGRRCAVGVFIPSEAYCLDMEVKPVDDLIDEFKDVPAIAAMSPHRDLLRSLQQAHDGLMGWYSTAHMRDALRNAAGDAAESMQVNNLVDTAILDTLSFSDR